MRISVNGSPLDWPKQTITEAQLRLYAGAPPGYGVWQHEESTGRTREVSAIADLRDGRVFRTVKRKDAGH